jgi:excisionase family DNA binding protein
MIADGTKGNKNTLPLKTLNGIRFGAIQFLGRTIVAQNGAKSNKKVRKGGNFVQNRYFSCKDIASMTGKTVKTVWGWCKTGKLKASRPGGRDYMIKEADFNEFMNGDTRKKAITQN